MPEYVMFEKDENGKYIVVKYPSQYVPDPHISSFNYSLGNLGFIGRFVKIDPDSEAFKNTRDFPGEGDGFDRLSNITKLTTYVMLEAIKQNVLSEEEVQTIFSNLLKEFNWTSNFRTARDYLFDLEQERKAEKFA